MTGSIPVFLTASRRYIVPIKLTLKVPSLSSHDGNTKLWAAKWKILSGRTFSNTRCTATPISVTKADLVMSAVSSPATAVTGGTVAITNTVANQGSGAAVGFYIGFYLSSDATITTSDVRIGSRYINVSVPAGTTAPATTPVTIPASLAPGPYYLGAIADYASQIAETDETNNALTANTITLTPGADLVMTSVSSAATAVTGGPLAITDTVTNQGSGAIASFYLRYYLSTDATITPSDLSLGYRYLGGLNAGASSPGTTLVTLPTSPLPGSYTLGAIADYNNLRPESNETNNALAGTALTLSPGADLVMTAVSGPATALRGTAISLSNTVLNQGSGAAGGFWVGLYLSSDAVITTSDIRVGSRWVASLAAGATSAVATSVTLPATLASGPYFLGAMADSDARARESEETNNSLAGATITIN